MVQNIIEHSLWHFPVELKTFQFNDCRQLTQVSISVNFLCEQGFESSNVNLEILILISFWVYVL